MARKHTFHCNICGAPAIIRKKETMNNDYSKLYCSCTNPHCEHRFVINAEYSHSTQSSRLTKNLVIKQLIGMLSQEDRGEIMKALTV